MYFTDDSLFPEKHAYADDHHGGTLRPQWLPQDSDDIPVTFDQQVQAAVDCYNAGATMLHFHVRDPKTGRGSTNFDQYNELLARVQGRGAEDDHPGRRLDLVCRAPTAPRPSGWTTTRATC